MVTIVESIQLPSHGFELDEDWSLQPAAAAGWVVLINRHTGSVFHAPSDAWECVWEALAAERTPAQRSAA